MATLEDAFMGSKYKAVMEDTWGHLSFDKGVYDQTVTFVIDDGGSATLVSRDGIPNSPWEFSFISDLFNMFYENFAGYKSSRIYVKYEDKVEDEGVYQFKGQITACGKNRISRIRGTVKRIFTW